MADERAANAIDRRIGERVRARRLEIGMSQERLAEILGITFQQVQKYEKGVNRIAASRLHDISKALDMPIARFYEGLTNAKEKHNAKSSPAIVSLASTPEAVEVLTLMASMKSGKIRRRVVELARSLVEE